MNPKHYFSNCDCFKVIDFNSEECYYNKIDFTLNEENNWKNNKYTYEKIAELGRQVIKDEKEKELLSLEQEKSLKLVDINHKHEIMMQKINYKYSYYERILMEIEHQKMQEEEMKWFFNMQKLKKK